MALSPGRGEGDDLLSECPAWMRRESVASPQTAERWGVGREELNLGVMGVVLAACHGLALEWSTADQPPERRPCSSDRSARDNAHVSRTRFFVPSRASRLLCGRLPSAAVDVEAERLEVRPDSWLKPEPGSVCFQTHVWGVSHTAKKDTLGPVGAGARSRH